MRMLVIGLAVVCIAAVPRERTLMDHIDDVLELMQFDDGSLQSGNVRGNAYSDLRQSHDRVVDQLIEIAGTEKAVYAPASDSRLLAVHLLMQQYSSAKAVPVLVKYVDWEYAVGTSGTGILSPITGHPCAVALYSYGVKAVLPEIYRTLEQDTPSDKAIELYAWFIVESMMQSGQSGDEAIRAVEMRARQSPNNRNFSLLLDNMKKVWEKRRPKSVNPEGGLDPKPATELHTLQEHLDELLTTMQFDDGSLVSERVRSAAHEELGQAHVKLMLKLVEIVGTEKESYDRHRTDSRFMAVHFLGRMHYGEAVRAFVKHVDWEYKLPDRSPVGRVVKGPISDYPCAVMLHSRGTKALLAIFGALERDPPPSDKALELYAWLVILAYEYIGGDQEAIQLVEMKASRAENNKHLLLLLEKVKEIAEQRASEESK